MGYLSAKKLSLVNDYKTPDGNHSESCSLIALEIAEKLRVLDKEAYIVRFNENFRSSLILTSKALVPVIFQGRVVWYTHIVCCSEGLAYDPLCEKPIPLEEYANEVFGEEIAFEIVWSRDQIDEVLKRGK